MSVNLASLRSAHGIVLVLLLAGTPAAPAANHRIEATPEAEGPRYPYGPERGIRSYGVGATSEGFAPALSAPAESLSAVETEPMPLTGITRKISGTPMAGSVTGFRVAPNGSRVVFIANKDTVGLFELYSAPADGSTPPVKISTGLPFGAGDQGVSAFQITPDSTRVVFLADAHHTGGVSDIYSAPIDGAVAAIRLNLGPEAPVTAFGITPDSVHAVFFGLDSTGHGSTEVYAAAAGTASSARQLSDVGISNAAGDVVAADFTPDGSRILYAADATADEVFQWHIVSALAAGPGFDIVLTTALSSVTLGRISPDSSRVVYTADETTSGKFEVFSVPTAGGAHIKLNPAMVGVGASDLQISPDGLRVAYLADQNALGISEAYSAQITTAGSGVRLNLPLSGSQGVTTLTFSPDSSRVVYEADQTTPGTVELFGVSAAGGGTPSTLHGLTAPADAGQFSGLGTPIIGVRAVYPVFGSTVSLFSVPYDGALPFQQISLPPSPGDILRNAFLPTGATRLMAYGAGPMGNTITDEVQVVAIRGDLAAEPIHQSVAAGEQGVLGYEITSDEKYAIYRQDADTAGKPELYSYELDSDGDGVLGGSDNCQFISNPSQQPILFPTITASKTSSFSWTGIFDVRVVRGLISRVKFYEVLETAVLTDASGFAATGVPPSGDGWYYVVGHDCPGRSYQTVLGAEPGRDTAFP